MGLRIVAIVASAKHCDDECPNLVTDDWEEDRCRLTDEVVFWDHDKPSRVDVRKRTETCRNCQLPGSLEHA